MITFRDNGGKLPPGLGIIRNATGKREHIATWDEYREAEKQRQYGLKIAANYTRKRYGPKRKPIVKVRREVLSNSYGTLTRWNWRCNICGLGRAQSGWWIAMDTATHHARQHESR